MKREEEEEESFNDYNSPSSPVAMQAQVLSVSRPGTAPTNLGETLGINMDCRGQEETPIPPSPPHKEDVMLLLPPTMGIPVVLPVELCGAQAPVCSHLLRKLAGQRHLLAQPHTHHCHLTNWLEHTGFGV